MSDRSLFSILKRISYLLIAGTMLLVACKKADPINPPFEPMAEAIDSGKYNPNHYLPMKMGASWEYIHDDGKIEKVTCSEKISYEYTDAYKYKYVYKAHRLKSDYPYADLPEIEPEMNGSFISNEYSIYRPFRDFCQKSAYKDRKILDVKFGELRFQRDYACFNGPSSSYFITTLDSSMSIDSFNEVALVLYSRLETFRSSMYTGQDLDIDFEKLLDPISLGGNAAYSISWFAKGVGLIRRDIYENQKLVDRMQLVRYHFP